MNDVECKPGRHIIDFSGMAEDEARQFPDVWRIAEERVKEQRQDAPEKNMREKWWLFQRPRQELYKLLKQRGNGWLIAATSDTVAFVAVEFSAESPVIFSHAVNVLALEDHGQFAVVQSSIHLCWARRYGSSMKGDLRYTTTDCFENFPFASSSPKLQKIGCEYYSERSRLAVSRGFGLTDLYKAFHDHNESATDIHSLRDLHVEMDKAVAAAYGWDDLDLGHGFHVTRQGTRFTISESARREVLARLLKLNHERHAEEVAQGLHDKKAKGTKGGRGRKTKASSGGASLNFGDDEDDPDTAPASDLEPPSARVRASSRSSGATERADRSVTAKASLRPTPIDALDSDAVMAAFRQASRGRGRMERDELLKEVSLLLGYQRLGPRIEEALRGHLRAALRRRIVEADGPQAIRPGAATMADYDREELRESFCSVMRKGTRYDREDVITALARHLGFVRLTDTIHQSIKSAITSAIRHGDLHSEGGSIWRE